MVEASILELYSSVDCTAKVLRAIYGPASRGFKDLTRFLFKNFQETQGAFPDELKNILLRVTWYDGLLFLRDELTHLGTGSCHLDHSTTKVRYMHVGLKTNGKPLIVDDVFRWLDGFLQAINLFFGQIFHFLRASLKSGRVMLICGMVEGRMLMRYVDPTEDITFASGVCGSYQWFEQHDAPTCPFVAHCGAYARTRPTMNPASLLAKQKKSEQ